jgi:hypothetical protein
MMKINFGICNDCQSIYTPISPQFVWELVCLSTQAAKKGKEKGVAIYI